MSATIGLVKRDVWVVGNFSGLLRVRHESLIFCEAVTLKDAADNYLNLYSKLEKRSWKRDEISRSICRKALADGKISVYPLGTRKLPRKTKAYKVRVLTVDEARQASPQRGLFGPSASSESGDEAASESIN